MVSSEIWDDPRWLMIIWRCAVGTTIRSPCQATARCGHPASSALAQSQLSTLEYSGSFCGSKSRRMLRSLQGAPSVHHTWTPGPTLQHCLHRIGTFQGHHLQILTCVPCTPLQRAHNVEGGLLATASQWHLLVIQCQPLAVLLVLIRSAAELGDVLMGFSSIGRPRSCASRRT